MIDLPTLLAYLAACVVLVVTPGPGQALTLSRTWSEGARAGILTALGLNLGTMAHAVAAALGLSALLARSPVAFAVVQYAGATYLVLLGLRMWRSRSEPTSRDASVPPTGHPFLHAIAIGTVNPKVALFFLVFLPPFVDAGRGPVFAQMLLLGALLAAIDLAYALVLVRVFAAASGAIPGASRLGKWRSRISGAILVALGARLAA